MGRLSMLYAGCPWYHALYMGILPTLFPIQKEERAGISSMENVTQNQVQATEAWFMRSTCRCGALGEESRGVWVSRMLPESIQQGLKKGDYRLLQQKKARKTWVKKLILHKSTWFHKTIFYSTTCTWIPQQHMNKLHIIPHLIVLFHIQ